MSRLADKLQSVAESLSPPIGFRPAVSQARKPALLLIAGLSGTQVKEARIAADVNVDAGLIVSQGTNVKTIRQLIEALGNVPLGVFVRGMSEREIDELVSLGCDFILFDTRVVVAALRREEVGRFMMIEPSLDEGLVRAINSLEIDGVFISSGGDSPMTVEHVLVCRRFVELLEKPVIVSLPSLATKEELTSLWQAGADGVVAPSTQSSEALAELKRIISDLPGGARVRRARPGVALPRYAGGMVGEDDEQEEKLQP